MQEPEAYKPLNNKFITRLFYFFNRHINFKMGALSGLVAGSIVFVINHEHMFWPAFASFGKQFAFNLFMAGFNTRTCEKIANAVNKKNLSLLLGSTIPSAQAFIILYAIHYFGGTPKPMTSTLWQVPFNLIIFMLFTLVYKQAINQNEPAIKTIIHFFRMSVKTPIQKINTAKNRKRAS